MREEPVAIASGSSAYAASSLVKKIRSSASRERCVSSSDDAKRYSAAKSRSETASIEFAVARAKPSERASASRSIGERRAGERAGAERAFVAALDGAGETRAIAAQHLDVREAPVSERDRLGLFRMRVAGHRRRRFFGARDSPASSTSAFTVSIASLQARLSQSFRSVAT